MEKPSTSSPRLTSRNNRGASSDFKSLLPLKKSFYRRPSPIVARALLGKWIVRSIDEQTLICRIVETEAYEGNLDPASHAFRGITPRTRPMFEAGGILYVYFSYGVHHCMNVVTGVKGVGEAVLLRAAEPIEGMGLMYKNRNLPATAQPQTLLSGPGKLCQALSVGLDMNFHDLTLSPLTIVEASLVDQRTPDDVEIITTPRIGISKAKEAPLRFCLKSSSHLSRRLAP